MNNNQKFINENFKRWINEEVEQEEINEELLEEGIILTIQQIRLLVNIMQVIIRTEKGRNAIRRIPIAGDEILAAVQMGDKAVQFIQDIAEKIKSENPIIYRLVWYPFVATAFLSNYIQIPVIKFANEGAKILKMKQQQAKIEGDSEKVAELEDVKQKQEQALENAQEIKSDVVEPALEDKPSVGDRVLKSIEKKEKEKAEKEKAEKEKAEKERNLAALRAATKRTTDDADEEINE